MAKIPTSDLNAFKQQLMTPNMPCYNQFQEAEIHKINKNLVLSFLSDSTGCGHIRNIFPMTYMNSVFGKTGRFNLLLTPVMIYQHDILARARSIYFQRTMDPRQVPAVQQYKELQKKYNYKMIYDIDDFIWKGPDVGEQIPDYNFGSENIKEPVRESSIKIMNMMDTVCVSTQFLKDYLSTHGVNSKITVVSNTVSKYFWGPETRKPIKRRIEKPKIINSCSPTHYHNPKKLKGDWDNAWCEWVIKNVMENKIEFLQMGGLPFFFEGLVNKPNFKVINWVNSYQYHLPIKQFRPDFGISPLVPNYFNYSKSYLKYQEYCAVGAVGIGTVFTNGKPSPYDVCQVTAKDTVTVKEIDDIFWPLVEPDTYNDIIKKQYKQMDDNGWWLESKQNIDKLISIF